MGALEARSAIFASRNPDKARELEQLLPGWQVEPLAAGTFPPETGKTYYENARGKALYGRSLEKRPLWVIGEDSGIEVAALDWGPGVFSARFGGDDPVGRMLAALEGIEGEARRARYVSELVAVSPAGEELRGSGTLLGRIGHEPRGSEGFGYDPIFLPEDEERTVAELGNDWKRWNSHRARAARALLEVLES
ncbi:MAG TPA: non-canonical purine NTP pyrophosphatase [Gaiellaceae bacterium]|jgi:XTP/dITP diphosphohydrolase